MFTCLRLTFNRNVNSTAFKLMQLLLFRTTGQSVLNSASAAAGAGSGGGGDIGSTGSSVGSSGKLVTSVVNSLGYKQETFNLDTVVDATVSHKPIPATDKIR